MMNNFVRLGVGVLGSCFALLMYGASITTFKRVIEKRTTGSFSGFPYAIALFNCLLYTWYGSPLISNGWDNVVVMVVNGIGCFYSAASFASISVSLHQNPKNIGRMVLGLLVVFGAIAISSFCAVHDHNHKKMFVGTAGMVATVILYASPLSRIRLVIQTKSVEFMPSVYFSLFAFLGSLLWMVYGALSRDIIIMAPNIVGVPLGLGYMVLYCIYRHKTNPRIEAAMVDAGQELESIEQHIEKNINDYTEDIEIQLKV